MIGYTPNSKFKLWDQYTVYKGLKQKCPVIEDNLKWHSVEKDFKLFKSKYLGVIWSDLNQISTISKVGKDLVRPKLKMTSKY